MCDTSTLCALTLLKPPNKDLTKQHFFSPVRHCLCFDVFYTGEKLQTVHKGFGELSDVAWTDGRVAIASNRGVRVYNVE